MNEKILEIINKKKIDKTAINSNGKETDKAILIESSSHGTDSQNIADSKKKKWSTPAETVKSTQKAKAENNKEYLVKPKKSSSQINPQWSSKLEQVKTGATGSQKSKVTDKFQEKISPIAQKIETFNKKPHLSVNTSSLESSAYKKKYDNYFNVKEPEDNIFERFTGCIDTYLNTDYATDIFKNSPEQSRNILSDLIHAKSQDQINSILDECIKLKTEANSIDNRYPLLKNFNNTAYTWFEYLDSIGHYSHREVIKPGIDSMQNMLDELGTLTNDIYTKDGNIAEKILKAKEYAKLVKEKGEQVNAINIKNSFSQKNEETIILASKLRRTYETRINDLEDVLSGAELEGAIQKYTEDFYQTSEFVQLKSTIDDLHQTGEKLIQDGFPQKNMPAALAANMIPEAPSFDMNNPMFYSIAQAKAAKKMISSLCNSGLKCSDFGLPENIAKFDSINSCITDINSNVNSMADNATSKVTGPIGDFNSKLDSANQIFDSSLKQLTSPEQLKTLQKLNSVSDADFIKMINTPNVQSQLNNTAQNMTDSMKEAAPELTSAAQSVCDAANLISQVLNNIPKLAMPALPVISNILNNKLNTLKNALRDKYAPLNDLMNLYDRMSRLSADALKNKLSDYAKNSLDTLKNAVSDLVPGIDQLKKLYDNCKFCINPLNKLDTDFTSLQNSITNFKQIDVKASFSNQMNLVKNKMSKFADTSAIMSSYNSIKSKCTSLAHIPDVKVPKLSEIAKMPMMPQIQMSNCLTTGVAAIKNASGKEEGEKEKKYAVSASRGKLKCDKGIGVIPIQVPPAHEKFGPGKYMLKCSCQTFGAFPGCLNTANPLAPPQFGVPPFLCMGVMIPGKFNKGSESLTADGQKALTNKCKRKCSFAPGGTISIADPGQDITTLK